MIAGHQAGGPLPVEELFEGVGRPVDERAVEGASEDGDPGSVSAPTISACTSRLVCGSRTLTAGSLSYSGTPRSTAAACG